MQKKCIIHPSFTHGENFRTGNFCVIEEDVVVGDNVKLGHYVVLKSGTRFGNNIDFADYCCTTGICYVGNNVNIRTRSTISKSLIIEDKVFIGAGVMTSHTKNVHHQRPDMKKEQSITYIDVGVVIGSHSNLIAGINIGNNVVIGYSSNVTGDLLEPGVYFGNPAKKGMDLPNKMYVKRPKYWKPYAFSKKMLDKYLPFVS